MQADIQPPGSFLFLAARFVPHIHGGLAVCPFFQLPPVAQQISVELIPVLDPVGGQGSIICHVVPAIGGL